MSVGYTQPTHHDETLHASYLDGLIVFETVYTQGLNPNEAEGDGVAKYGYARASTKGQDVAIQVEALTKAGCVDVRQEIASGSRRDGRRELDVLLTFLRAGDFLIVTRIDRLARSIRDLQNIVHELNQKGVHLMATNQPIDTKSAAGKAFLDMLGVFAEFETNLRRERQIEGIEKAKARGVYRGRRPSIDAESVQRLKSEGFGATAIAQELGIGRASVYRILGNLA